MNWKERIQRKLKRRWSVNKWYHFSSQIKNMLSKLLQLLFIKLGIYLHTMYIIPCSLDTISYGLPVNSLQLAFLHSLWPNKTVASKPGVIGFRSMNTETSSFLSLPEIFWFLGIQLLTLLIYGCGGSLPLSTTAGNKYI